MKRDSASKIVDGIVWKKVIFESNSLNPQNFKTGHWNVTTGNCVSVGFDNVIIFTTLPF